MVYPDDAEDTALCAQQLASKEHDEAEAKRSYGQAFAEALTTGCLDDATRALVACGFTYLDDQGEKHPRHMSRIKHAMRERNNKKLGAVECMNTQLRWCKKGKEPDTDFIRWAKDAFLGHRQKKSKYMCCTVPWIALKKVKTYHPQTRR